MFAKAARKLTSARMSLSVGDWEQTASCAYYAAFHAVSALLESRGQTYSSHHQTIGAFNKTFVATGLLPRETGRKLADLFDDRQDSDYNIEVIISEEMAINDLAFATELIRLCRAHLGLPVPSTGDDSPE
jgi:uncharacterized protein (UPF0332 family)